MSRVNPGVVSIAAAWLAIALALTPDPAWALEEPTGVLTLSDALALALTENPELAPFAWRERANEAQLLQAKRRPNPELGLEAENLGGTGSYSGSEQLQTTLQLSQLIELGGKRGARMAVASQARAITRSDYESKRVEVLADVTQRFTRVLANQHMLELAVTNRQLAADALQTVQQRAKAGKAPALEERKAEVALARAEVVVEGARHELGAARKILTASWQNRDPVFERAGADLFARDSLPPFDDLARLVSGSPEVTTWASETQLRAAEVKLARSQRLPDPTLSGGIRRFGSSGDQTFVLGLSMPLLIFDRNQGGSEEAEARLGRVEAERKAAEVRLHTVLLGLYEEMVRDLHVMEGLEREILPKAEDALRISRDGYAEGRFSYLDVLDAQRTIFEVRQEYIEAAASYHQFLVEIERLLGRPLTGAQQGETTP